MSRVPAITLLTVALAVAGCASDQQYLRIGWRRIRPRHGP